MSLPQFGFIKACAFLFSITSSANAFVPSKTFVATTPTTTFSSSLNMSINPAETAVLFIEYQNEFTTEGGKLHDAVKDVMASTNMLANSKTFMDAARSKGCTIVHCPIGFNAGHPEISKNPYGILAGVKEGAAFQDGEWGAAICDTMAPAEGDIVIKGKGGLCGFKSTNLDFVLRQNEIKNVIMGGFLTNCCVESTMRTAYENGYKVYTLKDCCAATSQAAQDAAIEHNFGMFSIPSVSSELIDTIG